MHYIIPFILFSLTLLADEALKKELLQRIVQPKVSLQSSYLDDANIKGYDGSVSVVKNRLSLNNEIAGISYTNWSFLWDNVAALPFGNGIDKPIKQMHSIDAKMTYPYKINEDWFLLSSLSLRSTFEKELQDSLGINLFSFASFKINQDHNLQVGAFVNYHPTTTLALPVLGYSYRARSNDGLQVIIGFPRTYVGYHYDSKTLLRFGMIFSQALIKLRKESTIVRDGYIEAKDYMSNIGLVYELDKNFSVEADLLYSIKRDFILYSAASDELQNYSVDPSFGIGARIKYTF